MALMNLRSCLCALTVASLSASAAVYNVKVMTDASPDYSDMESMVHSITSRWETHEEKCWAMFYWNNIARRQTTPMELHGLALTDPIRQFNDYGYAMCSTISGINCAIWDAMGLKARYWDISNHTVSEVEYGGGWHMYDNSMTAIYTRCDGKSVASVEEIGKTGACDASQGRNEPGHIARYHCLTATGPRGFLTGADTIRTLDEEYRCFNPNGLKYRSYFYDWDRGHRYILNLREGESYTRHYHSLGDGPEFYVPNNGKDPEAVNKRYKIRGNGVWTYKPKSIQPVYKINGANVITSMKITGANSSGVISVSSNNGLSWTEVWKASGKFDLNLIEPVNGHYEILVKAPAATGIAFETTTMLNSKTQPKLNIGRNTIYVGAGEQSDSIVFWPDLRAAKYKQHVVEERNITAQKEHPGYLGVLHATKAKEPAWIVFKMDAPRDITSFNYGGRMHNRAPGSRIDFLHSFDSGASWTRSYSLTNTAQPWDVIHYEAITNVPPGVRTVHFRYLLDSSESGAGACSLFAVRMEAHHKPIEEGFKPFQVTFAWEERQADYTTVKRSHSELVAKLPHRYTIDVAGADHPVMTSLRIDSNGTLAATTTTSPAEKFVPLWVTPGKNLAEGKPYTVTVPSTDQWGSGDPDGKRLTDGIVGPTYPGGTAPMFALGWNQGQKPVVTVDLGKTETCAAFRIQLGAGYPWWDALKGEVKDKVEVFTSTDGENFVSQGHFDFNLRRKDIPVNHFSPDEEIECGYNFPLIPAAPVQARYIRYKIEPARSITVSEVQVLDSWRSEPFDLRLAMP